jgi:hypothetical protein
MMQSITTGQVKAPPPHHHMTLPKIQYSEGKGERGERREREKGRGREEKKGSSGAGGGERDGGRRPVGSGARVKSPPRAAPASHLVHEPTTFRQLVEEVAKKNEILFMPTKRSYESKTIFSFGKVSLVIDKNVLLVWKGGKWMPVSLEELISLA